MNKSATDAKKQEQWLGLLIAEGLVTLDQLSECLELQKKLKQEGKARQLAEILVFRGYLSPQQVMELQNSVTEQIEIPGFRIISRLGTGGMGTVYKARQLNPPRTVALKVLSEEALHEPSSLARFFREVHALMRLRHPSITSGYGFAQHDGLYYLIMEYVPGISVAQIVAQKGPLSEAACRRILMPVAEALCYAWEHDFLHRDIKPANIMIAQDGMIKLCDFGLAKAVSTDIAATADGTVVGTPLFMSPEQMLSGELSFQSDIYALGATVYFMVTGQPPYAVDSVNALYQAKLNRAPLPPKKFARLSKGLNQFIMKTLARNPAQRASSPQDFLEQVRQLCNSRPTPVAPVDAQQELSAEAWLALPPQTTSTSITQPSSDLLDSSPLEVIVAMWQAENSIYLYATLALAYPLVLDGWDYFGANYLTLLGLSAPPLLRGQLRRFIMALFRVFQQTPWTYLILLTALGFPVALLHLPRLWPLAPALLVILWGYLLYRGLLHLHQNQQRLQEYSQQPPTSWGYQLGQLGRHLLAELATIFSR